MRGSASLKISAQAGKPEQREQSCVVGVGLTERLTRCWECHQLSSACLSRRLNIFWPCWWPTWVSCWCSVIRVHFCLFFFFSLDNTNLMWIAMQIVELNTQKSGAARTTACAFCSVYIRDPSPFGAGGRECTVNHHLFSTSLSLLFNMQLKVFLQRPHCSWHFLLTEEFLLQFTNHLTCKINSTCIWDWYTSLKSSDKCQMTSNHKITEFFRW